MPKRPTALMGVLRETLLNERPNTQEAIQELLKARGFDINQSSVSRAMKKLGVFKAQDSEGKSIYQLPHQGPMDFQNVSWSHFVRSIESNEQMIVIKTNPGSASYIARFLDGNYPSEIIGTLAGDDAIFIAPRSTQKIPAMIDEFKQIFFS